MRRFSLLLILGIAISLLLPLNTPVQTDVLANSTKVVLDNNAEAIWIGKTPDGRDIWQATISAPKYLDDLQTPIEARWEYNSEKKEWNTRANLFTAIAKGTKVTVWYDGKKLSWQPDVFIGTSKQAVGTEQLLITDSINEYYTGNTLQWQYGDITRNVRIIEGMLQEYYTIDEMPGGDILIISHSAKDAGFIWTRPAEAWDSEGEPLNLTVDGDDLTLTVAAMEGATFPITIDPDTTFAGTYKDGYVRTDLYRGDSWNQAHDAIIGDTVGHSAIASSWAMRTAYNGGFAISRSFFYFDTSSLPDTCTITAATFRLRGWSDYDSSVSVMRGTQAATLTTADYDNFAGSEYAHQSWGSGYKNFSITVGDISKSGTTKFCAREYTYDYQDSSPAESVAYYDNGCYYYEQGIGYYPQLVIVFEASASPTITTNNATYVATTTARLNSHLDSDGGDYCDVRFQYGNSTGNYTTNTSWVNDTYTTGDSPYVDIASLINSTTYYFRVQVTNSEGSGNGSELEFTTGSGIEAPTNFTAYPSSHSVSLSWVKGINATNTIVRGQVGSYPANYTSGEDVYNDTMSTAIDTGLLPGTTYYYRAWGISGSTYSSNNASCVTTTLAGATMPSDPDAPDMPPGWFATPDYTNMEDFPLYTMVNDLADGFGMPRNSFWILGAMLIVAVVSLFIYRRTDSGVAGLLVGSGLIVVFSLQFGVPVWIILIFGILVVGVTAVARRT